MSANIKNIESIVSKFSALCGETKELSTIALADKFSELCKSAQFNAPGQYQQEMDGFPYNVSTGDGDSLNVTVQKSTPNEVRTKIMDEISGTYGDKTIIFQEVE